MPIYPYVCTACGHEFDTLQKLSDDPLTDCPACLAPGLRKRLTAPSFHLKGTGWYETDFKNSDKKKESGGKDDDAKQGKSGEGNGKQDQGGKAAETANKDSKGAASDSASKSTAASSGKDD